MIRRIMTDTGTSTRMTMQAQAAPITLDDFIAFAYQDENANRHFEFIDQD